MWLVLSMITDVSANSHTDGEDNDNEHTVLRLATRGKGCTGPLRESASGRWALG